MDHEKQPERICRNCENATTEPGNTHHYKVALRNCALLPVWQFVTGGNSCSEWRPKSADEQA